MIRIPGESTTVAAGARELDEMASTLLRLADTLDRVADENVTIGDSVDAIRERTTATAGGVRAAHPRYETTASALHDYAVALHDAQDRFTAARSVIEAEADQIRRYEHQIWEIMSQDIMAAITMPDPAQAAEDARRLAYLRSQVSSHRAAQAAAQSRLDSAVADWHHAAAVAAGRISPVLGQLNDTLLDRIGAAVDDLGDFLAAVGEWVSRFLESVITSVLLVLVVVDALVILIISVVLLLPALLLLLVSGTMSMNELLEFLIGIALVILPSVSLALAALMQREADTPTPVVHPGQPSGGRFVKKGDKTNYEYLFDRNGELDNQGGLDHTVVEVVQVLDANGNPVLDENGNPVWRVMLPSTMDWQLIKDGAFGDNGAVNDLGSNLALILTPDQQAAYERAVIQAMKDAGIGPNDSVMLTGWSQGGILAGAMASDPSVPFNIRAIVVAGAPIDHMDIPDSVSVIAFQHEGDHVHLLDGTPAHQGSNWVTVQTMSSGTDYPHNAGYYADTAVKLESFEGTYPNLSAIEDSQSMYFSGNEVAYQYEFSEKDSAIS